MHVTFSAPARSWELSPEWWGSQGGGWGRDPGDVVFERKSASGNGVVMVTAHPAAPLPGEVGEGDEWRVLRFNDGACLGRVWKYFMHGLCLRDTCAPGWGAAREGVDPPSSAQLHPSDRRCGTPLSP